MEIFLVKKFNELGSNIIATGTNENKLESLNDTFVNIKTLKFKLDDHEKIENFIEEINTTLGGLDILVNNAGITLDDLSIRLSEEKMEKSFGYKSNIDFLMCKYAIKKMLKKKSGKIINITSIVGHTGNLGQANYSASKAGIVAFSKVLQ